jgi:hypothetical protein
MVHQIRGNPTNTHPSDYGVFTEIQSQISYAISLEQKESIKKKWMECGIYLFINKRKMLAGLTILTLLQTWQQLHLTLLLVPLFHYKLD